MPLRTDFRIHIRSSITHPGPIIRSEEQTEPVELQDDHHATAQHYTLEYGQQPTLFEEAPNRQQQIRQTQSHQDEAKREITFKHCEIVGEPAGYAYRCTGNQQSRGEQEQKE